MDSTIAVVHVNLMSCIKSVTVTVVAADTVGTSTDTSHHSKEPNDVNNDDNS